MNPGRREDNWFPHAAAAVLAAAGGLLGWILLGGAAALAGAMLGLLGGLGSGVLSRRRRTRRQRLLSLGFPEHWRDVLARSCDHYDRLPDALRTRFEDDLRLFLDEKRITGVGVQVTDELRVLVAASAVTLSLGWPDYEWDQLAEVLLYPQDFDRDYSFEDAELAGQAHPWGTLILSVPALRQSFEDPDDAYHVGFHEFAHLLDVHQTRFDGIPSGLAPEREREWVAVMRKEMERLRHGKSVIDPYGSEEPAEFLAVAVEAFFEAPLALRQRHRELYAILAEYFRQDPAAWDDARGLYL